MYYLIFYVDVIRASKEIKLLVTDFLLVGLPLLYLSRFEPHSDCLWESHVVYGEGENFLFRTIYRLAMTQESEIILTTCHKTPKSQMYCTDVVFINGKNYTHLQC